MATERQQHPGERPPRIALVLAGGAARGAYEVGVAQYILEDVSRTLGRDAPIDILCGTSVGAINACMLAAMADRPATHRADALVRHWTSLRIADVVKPEPREIFAMVRGLFGWRPSPGNLQRGGLLDPRGLEKILATNLPFHKIGENLRERRLSALTVSTTQISTGRTLVFVQRTGGGAPRWGNDPTVTARAAEIGLSHALASAAIPFLFPPVQVGDEWFCDGGLRQNVPLSPARRMGATGLIVINPRYISREEPTAGLGHERELAYPGPLFLMGKVLNALLLDRIDNDIDRLHAINDMLDAGTRHYGPEFVADLNREMGNAPAQWLRPLHAVHVRVSEDIGRLAMAFIRSPGFESRARGLVGLVLKRFADSAGHVESDFLSYLLFDGEFARQLIELGRADAKKNHEALCGIFEERLRAA